MKSKLFQIQTPLREQLELLSVGECFIIELLETASYDTATSMINSYSSRLKMKVTITALKAVHCNFKETDVHQILRVERIK